MILRYFVPTIVLLLAATAQADRTIPNLPSSKMGSKMAPHVPVPGEATADQLASCKSVLEAWEAQGPKAAPRVMQVVYWTPADRDPLEGYQQRLTRTLLHIQAFYRREMGRWGFEDRTIGLEQDAGGLVRIHVAKGTLKSAECSEQDSSDGQAIRRDCVKALQAAGIDGEQETIVIFCNLADWDPVNRQMSHHSPYYAGGTSKSGTAWQLDSPLLDSDHLAVKDQMLTDGQYGRISLGKYNSIFVGGVCHELGHALGLPHGKESLELRKVRGTALMGSGNRTYGDELRGEGMGSFLAQAHALKLAAHPQFSKSTHRMRESLKAEFSGWKLELVENGLSVSGKVQANLPVHAVIAYGDPDGGGDYDSETAGAVVQPDGSFLLHVPKPEKRKPGRLALVAIAANGAATAGVSSGSGQTFPLGIQPDGNWDISDVQARLEFENAWKEKARGALNAASLEKLPAKTQEALRRLDAAPTKPTSGPDKAEASVTSLPLSDTRPASVKVGYGKLDVDRTPQGRPLIHAQGVAAHGLSAHADSELVYQLGGSWKSFEAGVGLLDGGSGRTTAEVLVDGKVLWKARETLATRPQACKVDVTGAQELKLVFKSTGDNNGGCWTAWFEPVLSR